MIPIVKPYLPSLEKYLARIEGVYERNWLTNNGPLVQELEAKLAETLGVSNLMLVANGTLALQVAYRALGLESGEVLTTPFTFAATPASLKWQNLQPRFVDIDPQTFNIDADRISQSANAESRGIVAVHVYGNPCDVEALDAVAQEKNIPLIYDAAHAFATKLQQTSVLNYGDASTLSLHATKMFHCVEGGAIIFKDGEVLEKARRLINFGFDSSNLPVDVGINAKLSEFHAAMGLAQLNDLEWIFSQRKAIADIYHKELRDIVQFQQWHENSQEVGAYMPIVLEDESELLRVEQALKLEKVQSRRYFYPHLSGVAAYADDCSTPVAADIASRVLCLPIYCELEFSQVRFICKIVKRAVGIKPS